MCAAHCGTVDGGVGTDLDIVIDLYDSYLFDLVVMSLAVRSESEAVGTHHGTRMDGAASTYAAAMIHYGAGIHGSVGTYCHSVADVGVGIYFHVLAKGYSFGHIGACADVASGRHFNAICHKSTGLDAGVDRLGELRGQAEQSAQACVGIVDTDESRRHGMFGQEVALHQHCCGAGGVDMMFVFRIGDKGQCSLAGLFYFGQRRHCRQRISFNGSSEMFGNCLCGQLHKYS